MKKFLVCTCGEVQSKHPTNICPTFIPQDSIEAILAQRPEEGQKEKQDLLNVYAKLSETVIGLPLEMAECIVAEHQFSHRLVKKGNLFFITTRDYVPSRINFFCDISGSVEYISRG